MGECDVCGADDRPVERTTAETSAPLEVDMCPVCAHVQGFEQPEGRCLQCGDAVDPGHYVEVEFPLGKAELPARIAGHLCGECAGWIGHRLNYHGVENDAEAHAEYCRLLGIDVEDLAEA